MKICKECEEEFAPSSRHLKCPKCRSKKIRIPCACGKPMAKEARTCKDCRESHAGSGNPNWRGGGTKHQKGYIMRRVDGKYIFEHILVMEDHLGRKLVPGETVHHIYGQRDDNRIENLELWCKPQPSGIRAEDAYKHALEIVERYQDLFNV